MVTAYNFVGAWQLIPEKSNYSEGIAPKSMLLQIELHDVVEEIFSIKQNWFTHDNQSFATSFNCKANVGKINFEHMEVAEEIEAKIVDKDKFEINTFINSKINWEIVFYINSKGYLEVRQRIIEDKREITKFDIYHKQLSVLPYASSVSGVSIMPTQEGVIKHKALQAMAEQTDMHLLQIKQQIELLATQAHAIQCRKELSLIVYNAKINFVPQIGQIYHLYERNDGSHILSLIAPESWSQRMPYKSHVSSVKLLADHTWSAINE